MTNLYETIFKRKSVRDYNMDPLDEDTLKKIKEFAEKVKPLEGGIRYRVSIMNEEDIRKQFSIKAPHYLCFYSGSKGRYLMNAGYILQHVDLYLSQIGLGSCWLGMAKPLKEAQKAEGMDFVIMLAFGKASEAVHRDNAGEFKRKPLKDISNVKGGEALLEPIRLAPSATNGQPWYFSGTAQRIVISRKKLNFVTAAIFERINKIDIGIVLCHLMLSAGHMGKNAEFVFKTENVPVGYEYMATAVIPD